MAELDQFKNLDTHKIQCTRNYFVKRVILIKYLIYCSHKNYSKSKIIGPHPYFAHRRL